MKIQIEICGRAGKGITEAQIKSAIRRTLELSHEFVNFKKILSVSLAFVSEKEIKKVNRIYRSINKVTDVLSFSYFEQNKNNGESSLFLGELVICVPYVLKSAKLNQIDYSKQLIYVIAHGLLHLIGMRHSKKMYALQDKIVTK